MFIAQRPHQGLSKLAGLLRFFCKNRDTFGSLLDEFGRSRYRGEKPSFYTFPTMS